MACQRRFASRMPAIETPSSRRASSTRSGLWSAMRRSRTSWKSRGVNGPVGRFADGMHTILAHGSGGDPVTSTGADAEVPADRGGHAPAGSPGAEAAARTTRTFAVLGRAVVRRRRTPAIAGPSPL
ncbi:hypothetical protein ACFQ0G_33690 [Streptomyces chiangmaiensis]